ncbi:MAG: dockerin type I domain-containing protein [Verrucomicrobiota bacterium]
MAESNRKTNPEPEPQIPARLAAAFQKVEKVPVFVPPTIDEAILKQARAHLQAAPRQFRARSWFEGKWIFRWAALAAVFVAGLVLLFTLPKKNDPHRAQLREDVDGNGRVDILDAFYLARLIESGQAGEGRFDLNGDQQVNRADVDQIAARAVRIEEGGNRESVL